MSWLSHLEVQLEADRRLVLAPAGPFGPLVKYQREQTGRSREQIRLPQYFRGDRERAKVCFLGPHVADEPAEAAPTVAATVAEYLAFCATEGRDRLPYSHYTAIMGEQPWLATELIHWPSDKETALRVLKGPRGRAAVAAGLQMTWKLLASSPVEVLVLTGNDALAWVLPQLGWTGGKLAGVTQVHGQTISRFPLPGAPDGRLLTVIASFHWSPEMPLFVRKVPGLAGLPVREAIGGARRMVAEAVQRALFGQITPSD